MKILNTFKSFFEPKVLPSNIPVVIYGEELFKTTKDIDTFFKIRLELLKRGYLEFKQSGYYLYLDNTFNCIKEDINNYLF